MIIGAVGVIKKSTDKQINEILGNPCLQEIVYMGWYVMNNIQPTN